MQIKVYSTPSCIQCEMTKKLLDKNGIRYEEVDLSSDTQALAEIQELGYQSAPVVITDNDSWSGFRLEKIQKISHLLFGEKRVA